jgi:hypothetical protein
MGVAYLFLLDRHVMVRADIDPRRYNGSLPGK